MAEPTCTMCGKTKHEDEDPHCAFKRIAPPDVMKPEQIKLLLTSLRMTTPLETEIGRVLRVLELIEVFPTKKDIPAEAVFSEMAEFFSPLPNLCKLVLGRGE